MESGFMNRFKTFKLSKKKSGFINFFLPIVVLYLICLTSCGSDKSIQGFSKDDGFDPNDRGVVGHTLITTLEIEETFSDTLVATGNAPLLLLGAFKNIETNILLKFENIPDTVTITNATISIRTRELLGDNRNKSSFMASIHAVREDWEEGKVTEDNFANSFDANAIASAEILSVAGTALDSNLTRVETVRFSLNSEGVDLVKSWADTTSENFGFLVNFDLDQSLFIKEFYSKDALTQPLPTLDLEILDGTEKDTLFIPVTADAYLFSSLIEPPAGRLYVDNVFSRQTVVKFDLSGIDSLATINRADLILTLDRDNSIIGVDPFILQMISLDTPFESPESVELGTISVDPLVIPLITRDMTTVTIPIRSLIQLWVNNRIDNNGFLIRSATPGLDVARVAFRSTTMDSAASTRLEIDFTTSPKIP